MTLSPDIYCAHFGLAERPFLVAPDPAYMFWSRAHRAAHTMLEYGLTTRAPITLLTGEVGAGKTTLLKNLLEQLGEEASIGLVSNPQGGQGELLRWVLHAFGVESDAGQTYVDLFARLQDFLVAEYAAGRRCVLVVDEAQHLGPEALEELRMYTNINSGKDEILQLVLVGQPELRDVVGRPDLTQFAQRVGVSYHLPTLGPSEVAQYVSHRMAAAGGRPDTFDAEACALVHEHSGGVPRLVNQLCDLSLLYAYTEDLQAVTAETVRQVVADGVFFGGGAAQRESLRLVDPAEPDGPPASGKEA